jgi:hypothetical protein
MMTRVVLKGIRKANGVLPGVCIWCKGGSWFSGPYDTKSRAIICNVYEDGRWNRVEIFHLGCYSDAGQPYGEPVAQGIPR